MLRRPDHVHSAQIGHGTTAVLNVRTGRWLWLNPDSRRIWDAALAGRLPVLVEEITARGVPLDQVQQAVDATVVRLADQGLIVPVTPARPGWRRRFTTWRTA